jgi:hypothetical protein
MKETFVKRRNPQLYSGRDVSGGSTKYRVSSRGVRRHTLYTTVTFICFESLRVRSVALEALVCSLLFSKCSAKKLRLSARRPGTDTYFRVANHPVNSH